VLAEISFVLLCLCRWIGLWRDGIGLLLLWFYRCLQGRLGEAALVGPLQTETIDLIDQWWEVNIRSFT
jgi:hypothetical protein